MSKIAEYTIRNGADIKKMIEDAIEMLRNGWQPLGGAMPNNWVTVESVDWGLSHTAHTTYSQTWVRREAE